MKTSYLSAIQSFEGFTPAAKWDYAQHSNGYGTKARFAGEVIDKDEANLRLADELKQSRSIVESFASHLDEGTAAALTSLTFNAGTAWMKGGLGEAVARGDLETARNLFVQYDKAGGQVLPGLTRRRAIEASWIGAGAAGPQPERAQVEPLVTATAIATQPVATASAAVDSGARGAPATSAAGAHPQAVVASESLDRLRAANPLFSTLQLAHLQWLVRSRHI